MDARGARPELVLSDEKFDAPERRHKLERWDQEGRDCYPVGGELLAMLQLVLARGVRVHLDDEKVVVRVEVHDLLSAAGMKGLP